jgi:diacylglycerol kinase
MIKIKRLTKSFTYAFKGLFKTFQEEQNLKLQALAGVIVVIIGFIFHLKASDWIALVITITLVLLMEILNSAVERVADVLKPRIDNYVKEIKDIMAAGVLLASIMAILIGIFIFFPYISPY